MLQGERLYQVMLRSGQGSYPPGYLIGSTHTAECSVVRTKNRESAIRHRLKHIWCSRQDLVFGIESTSYDRRTRRVADCQRHEEVEIFALIGRYVVLPHCPHHVGQLRNPW